MKKNHKVLMAALAITVAGIFSSCSKDNEDEFINYLASFESLLTTPNSYWRGDTTVTPVVENVFGTDCQVYKSQVKHGNVIFKNTYNKTYDSWSGFAYSNMSDTATAGFTNQYSVFTKNALSGSENFGIIYGQNYTIEIADTIKGEQLESIYLNNSTYTALTMRDGDQFTEKFGGATGIEPDWFMVTIKGIGVDGIATQPIDFYLADYRFSDNTKDYIIKEWTKVDLSSLGIVKRIEFTLSSSDVGTFGMSTPAYFCIDNLRGRVKM